VASFVQVFFLRKKKFTKKNQGWETEHYGGGREVVLYWGKSKRYVCEGEVGRRGG